jgi:type I restriction enzyme, R subunit
MQGPEYRETQKPAIDLLCDHLGYDHLSGKDVAGERTGDGDVFLTQRLLRKLREINPGLSETGAKQAVAGLQFPIVIGLLDAGEKAHRLLSRWITVDEVKDRQVVGRSVRYIDFDSPDNNDFLVVSEFRVKGPRVTRRLDLVVFVNGIPLVVVECKDPAKRDGAVEAIEDLLLYQDAEMGVTRLFHAVQLCLGICRHDACYGPATAQPADYRRWKSYWPSTKTEVAAAIGREPSFQDMTLAGMLSKPNLLDLTRNFVAFDRRGGRTFRKLTRYQQFEAVNLSLQRILDNQARPSRERGGVVWHTQGSGKSLTMLWLALKLRRRRELKNPTLLVITDRRDLDRQIHETFTFCGFENPVRASRVSHLRRLLNGPSGQTVMTTVQKFRDEVDILKGGRHPVLSESAEIYVLIDEAHRSEYGTFHANLRRALPNACLIAFTGTPIKKTTMTFGPYLHRYTMPQSVEDHATVPIYYESRLPELSVWGNKLDPMFDAMFPEFAPDYRQRLKRQEVNERRVGRAANRIERIAFDIYEHYTQQMEPDGFKGIVAVSSQIAAGRYYTELIKYEHLKDRVALLITQPPRKDSPLHKLREPFVDEGRIIDDFVNSDCSSFALIVVVDKYLTGFDAPAVKVLYLDKPLKEHGLLQAVARVNRPHPDLGKEYGLVVDYWGVSRFLDKALVGLQEEMDTSSVMQARSMETAYDELRLRRAIVFGLFPDGLTRRDIEPWLQALEQEDNRARFLNAYRDFYRALERLLPDEHALQFLGDLAWLRRVRLEMIAQYSESAMNRPEINRRVQELIDKHVRGENVRVLLKEIPILSEEFPEEVRKLHSNRARASRMEHALRRTITMKVAEDPAFYGTIRERLEQIIEDKRQQRLDDAREYQLMMGLRDRLKDGRGETARSLGVGDDTFALYGVLNSHARRHFYDTEIAQAKARELSDQLTVTLREHAVIDWISKEDVQREMRRRIKRTLRLAQWPATHLEAITSELMDLARVRFGR